MAINEVEDELVHHGEEITWQAVEGRAAHQRVPALTDRVDERVEPHCSGRQSSSVKAITPLRASATPRFRTAAGPAFG